MKFTKEEQNQIDAAEANEEADEQEFLDWIGDLDNNVPAKFVPLFPSKHSVFASPPKWWTLGRGGPSAVGKLLVY